MTSPPPPPLRRYALVSLAMLGALLALYGLVTALDLPLLSDPAARLPPGGPAAAALGVGLLVADVALPVPSSAVMIAHGALFGAALGTLLSLVGSVGAAALGFALGRRGGALLERLVSPAEKARADALLRRWGALAILVTRPIPLLAEVVALLAGASPLGWGRLLAASVAGALPAALLYALTGATSRGLSSNAAGVASALALALAVAALFYRLGRRA